MQGKALAALLASVLALTAAGCGGGADSSSSGPTETASPGGSVAVEKLEKEGERVGRERRQPRGEVKPQTEPEQGKGAAKHAEEAPRIPHHDSGGGSGQFRDKGGDNSIQEYGQEANASERERAAEALHAYLDSRVARRWAAACSYMAAQLVASLEQFSDNFAKRKLEGCPNILAALSQGSSRDILEAAAEIDVASLRADGDRGYLLYYGPDHNPYTIPVLKEEGSWKVMALDGGRLP